MVRDIIVIGLLQGSVYALLAVGFSLIFGVARILNLAHTAFYMLAAYGIFFLTTTLGVNSALSILISVILVSLGGMILNYLFISPIQEHDTAVIIVTVAIALILQALMLLLFGGHYRMAPALMSGYATVFGISITYQYLLTFGVVVMVLIAVWFLLMKTRLGLAIRAIAQDREVANLMGMNIDRIATYTVAISVALAAVAGAMVAPIYILRPLMWLDPLVLILVIVVLGGLGSVKGSFFSAYILAFVEVAVVFLLPGGSFLKVPIALAIMLIILLARPEGLFGIYFEGER